MAAVYLCSDLIASRLCYNPNGTPELWHFIKHYLHRVNQCFCNVVYFFICYITYRLRYNVSRLWYIELK